MTQWLTLANPLWYCLHQQIFLLSFFRMLLHFHQFYSNPNPIRRFCTSTFWIFLSKNMFKINVGHYTCGEICWGNGTPEGIVPGIDRIVQMRGSISRICVVLAWLSWIELISYHICVVFLLWYLELQFWLFWNLSEWVCHFCICMFNFP